MIDIIIKTVSIVIITYVFIFFFLSRIFVPNFSFIRGRLPDNIPKSMQEEINKIKKTSKSKYEFLEKSYNLLTKRFYGKAEYTYTRIYKLWKQWDEIWEEKGFAHCTWQNLFLRIFLVKSGLFKEEDIRIKYTSLFFGIHQYMEIMTEKGWIPVDLWSSRYGIKFGQKPHPTEILKGT